MNKNKYLLIFILFGLLVILLLNWPRIYFILQVTKKSKFSPLSTCENSTEKVRVISSSDVEILFTNSNGKKEGVSLGREFQEIEEISYHTLDNEMAVEGTSELGMKYGVSTRRFILSDPKKLYIMRIYPPKSQLDYALNLYSVSDKNVETYTIEGRLKPGWNYVNYIVNPCDGRLELVKI